jgi:hypothetical protein
MKKRSTAAAKARKLALVVRTGVKGGLMSPNHNEAVTVRTGVKGGLMTRIGSNHNEAVTVHTGVKGGMISPNHNEVLAR